MRLFFLLFLPVFVLLTACGREDNSSTDSIRVLYFAGVPLGDLMKAKQEDFTSQTGIEVEIETLPYDSIRPRQLQSFGKSVGDYDVVFVDDIWMYEYVNKGYLTPLGELAEGDDVDMSDFFEVALEAEAYLNDELWLIPQRADVQVLFYRPSLFEDPQLQERYFQSHEVALKVPETWQEYRQVAEFFTSEGAQRSPRLYGNAETLKRPHFAFEFFAMRYWAYSGTNFFDQDQAPLFASENAVQALSIITEMLGTAVPGSANAAHDETIAAFSEGRAAMAPQWFAFYSTLRDPELPIAGDLGVALVPGYFDDALNQVRRTPSIGGGSLGIPQNARNKDAAWEFIKYMTGKPFMNEGALAGMIVPRYSAYVDEEVHVRHPAVQTYLQSLEIAKFRPRTTSFAEVQEIIGLELSRAYVGETTPEEALERAVSELERRSLPD